MIVFKSFLLCRSFIFRIYKLWWEVERTTCAHSFQRPLRINTSGKARKYKKIKIQIWTNGFKELERSPNTFIVSKRHFPAKILSTSGSRIVLHIIWVHSEYILGIAFEKKQLMIFIWTKNYFSKIINIYRYIWNDLIFYVNTTTEITKFRNGEDILGTPSRCVLTNNIAFGVL